MEVSKERIEGSLRGDSACQKELYDLLLPYLNAICGRYLNELELRQDVLQESFMVIFNKIEQFDPQKGQFHSWAGRIVINNCLKQNKSGMRFFQFRSDKHDVQADPDVVSQLSNEELIRFLKTMPEKFYEVFILFVVEGYSHEEISEMLGIKVNLSRKRLARARAWLRAKPKSLDLLLGEYGYIIG